MSEIILRLPSRGTQYGYVEVRATPEEFGADLSAPESLGRMYQTYVEMFQKGEKAQKGASGPAHPALAQVVDVLTETSELAAHALDDDGKAHAIVEDILGPTTVVDETAAPWDAEAPPAKKKPWETGGTPKKLAPFPDLF